ncbi:MAG TPA: Crp/Fnr family transcriptional regulator [Nevskiaceae bacterium]|nr:Crp/Fnr family transcriptional regulator [Nevskiaceae bacterium]
MRTLHEPILDTIRHWRWFQYVPAQAHAWLASRASVQTIAQGTLLYSPGDPVKAIYGVIDGVFRIYSALPKGEDLTLEEVVAGGWFSHMIPDPRATQITHCVCQQDARVVVIPWSTVCEFGRRWPDFYRGCYEEFLLRAGVIIGRLELLSAHDLKVRLAVYLLRIAKLRGVRAPDGSIWLGSAANQSEVGARVGGARQRVNYALKEWSREGWLTLGKDGIRLLDLQAIRAQATRTGFDVDAYLGGWHGGWQGSS